MIWFQQNGGLPETISKRLLHIYGIRSTRIAEMVACYPELKESFCPETGAIKAEILFAVQEEMACTLGDILLRQQWLGLTPKQEWGLMKMRPLLLNNILAGTSSV